jgi:hypothetical protein
VPDLLLAGKPWYQELASEPRRRMEMWRSFLLAEDPKEKAVQRMDWTLGEATFRQRMRHTGGRPAPRTKGRPLEGASTKAADLLYN